MVAETDPNKRPSVYKTSANSIQIKQCGHGAMATNIEATYANCKFCGKGGYFNRACIKKRSNDNKWTSQQCSQRVVEVDSESGENHFEEGYDLGSVFIHSIQSKSPREVLAKVEFHSGTVTPHIVEGKVDTGATVSCIRMSMLETSGLTQKNLQNSRAILRGVSGLDLKNCGTIQLKITCNDHHDRVKFFISELGNEPILGVNLCKKFKLINVAKPCTQPEIIAGPGEIEAVSITEESQDEYGLLQEQLKDLMMILPDMFGGQVGLFEGEVDMRLTNDAKPVQLPPRAVPQSILPELKHELCKMEQEGIIRPCPETTD